MKQAVYKAIIPAAGFGTRMLPFTKAVPKELIPLVDKPVLQYVMEEAAASGITEVLLIINSGKEAVVRHFNPACELELHLKESGKSKLLAEICNTHGNVKIHYVYQEQLNGLGGAVSLAESFAGNDPVAVLLGDTVLDSVTDIPVTGQLIEVFKKFHSSVIALEQVVPEKISNYGIADIKPLTNGIMQLNDLIEKPTLENAPSNFAVASRYVFTPGIFAALRETAAGLHNEIQLTDAIRILLAREKIYGWQIAGKRFDLGNPAGFIAANIEYAMRRPELQRVLEPSIKNILNN